MCAWDFEQRWAASSELPFFSFLLSLLQIMCFLHKVDQLLSCLWLFSILFLQFLFWLQFFSFRNLVNAMLLFRLRGFSVFSESNRNVVFVLSELTEIPLSQINCIYLFFPFKLRIDWKLQFKSLVDWRCHGYFEHTWILFLLS